MPALEYDAFRRSLQKGEILPAYYFHGDQDFLKDEAVRELLARTLDAGTRDFNLDRRRATEITADDFATLALTPPMLAARRVVVVTEVEVLQQKRAKAQGLRAAIVDYLTHPSPDTLLILVQSSGEKVDAELARGAAAVDVQRLTPERIRKWIQHRAGQEGLEIDEAAALHLLKSAGDDLAQLAAELSKLKTAVRGGRATEADVEDLVGVRHGETANEFADAVTDRRLAAAADMVTHLLEMPQSSGVRLVSLLGVCVAGVAFARAQLDAGTAPGVVRQKIVDALFVARPSGLRGYKEEAERWTRDAAKWTGADCDVAFEALLRADRRLKSTALGNEAAFVLEAVLALAARERRVA